jgi:hypothetical protein
MPDGESTELELAPGLLRSDRGDLRPEQIERLWEVFVAISKTWGDPATEPLSQRSQWLEFLHVRTRQDPSYLEEYRQGIQVLEEWKTVHGAGAMTKLLTESGIKSTDPPTSPIAHVKKYVVDEFIRVWLATGGFRNYGAGNYNGYISGSRFAVRPPYRMLPTAGRASS